jgi:mannonate dehydratase
LEQTWRWFGPKDPIPLAHVVETGATGIVTALHDIAVGTAWSGDAIRARQALIAAAGLRWSVVESLSVSNAVKGRFGNWQADIETWKQSIRNLGAAGVRIVCYNFPPIIGWTRTDLAYPLRAGKALRFDLVDFVAYDVFILRRHDADGDYDAATVASARTRYEAMPEERRLELERVILAGLPGTDFTYDRKRFLDLRDRFAAMTADDLRSNLAEFHRAVVPVAEEAGVRLAIHPDDPPIPLFGMPRVVSTASDVRSLLTAVDSPANGLTFCVGSYGSREDNDIVAMIQEFAPRIHFIHLRNVMREAPGVFHEAEHLSGSTNMVQVILAIHAEEARRRGEGREDHQIPMRPDHGHVLAADAIQNAQPGYSYIGRLRGLAELRGVTQAALAMRH